MFLVGVGLYGILSYFVRQRRREIGIRMGLGGDRATISALLLRQTFTLLAPGIIMGGFAALLAGPAYRFLLYAVAPVDPKSLGISALLMTLVGTLATAGPIYQATRTILQKS